MQVRILSMVLRAGFAIFAAGLFVTTAWGTDHQTVLYNFNGTDGAGAAGGLIMDSAGNLYGVTNQGGTNGNCFSGCGTVFELSRNPRGSWSESVLYDFEGGNDGIYPVGNLFMDVAGNLYGVTSQGGTHGVGIVFELSANGSGGWTETVLYSLGTNSDESSPTGGLIMDAAGNLYGTASYGGSYGWGTVFKLSPSSGGWTETTLYSFSGGDDGLGPNGNLVMDAAGNLYGTTFNGGQGGGFCQGSGCGTVFQVSPGVSGWTETVLHSFNADEGYGPSAGLVMDAAGNLYGTAYQGGNLTGENCAPFGCGTVFEVSPNGGGWTETTLHAFGGQPDTGYPLARLLLDSAGNLYGTGTRATLVPPAVFELSPRQGGWLESLPFSFNPNDGPTSGVILDRLGELYGEAGGGVYGAGVAYELTSPSIRPASRAH